MLKSVTVINYKGEQKVMDLRNPESSGFLVYDISGLGPGKATINMTEISSYNGAVYNSSRLGTRNIVIPLKYMWANTIEESRYASYKYFPLMTKVKLIFETDNRLLAIDGYVESNEPAIFDQMSYTQVSILCEDPYFYSYENGGTQVVDVPHGSFCRLNYNGDVDSGVDIFFTVNESLTETYDYILISRHWRRTLRDSGVYQNMFITNTGIRDITGRMITAGDKLHLCTIKGHKSLYLERNGETYNVFNALSRPQQGPQTWITLSNGVNDLLWNGTETVTPDYDIDGRVEYQELYSGV